VRVCVCVCVCVYVCVCMCTFEREGTCVFVNTYTQPPLEVGSECGCDCSMSAVNGHGSRGGYTVSVCVCV